MQRLAVFLVAALCTSLAFPSYSQPLVRRGELVLKLKNGPATAAALASADYRAIPGLGKMIAHNGQGYLRVLAGDAAAAGGGGTTALYDRAYYDGLCADLKKRGVAERCSANFIVHAEVAPSDPYYSQLDGLANLNAPTAWNTLTDCSSLVVAVLDSGVDYTHPDLIDNMWVNPDEVPNNGIDDDGDGYVDDVYGVNTITGSGDPMDDNEHGTHVSGTIGASANNGIGVAGVCWQARIMAIKFLGADGSGDLYNAVTGIQFAVQHGAKVINASWGSYGYSDVLEGAIRDAGTAGVLFVAAAGNEQNDTDSTVHYPSGFALNNIVAVAATNPDRTFASDYSNYGATSVHVAATGTDVLSTVPGGGYAVLSGTSMATPHVSGIAALLLAHHPDLGIGQLKWLLINTVTPEATLVGITVAGGVVDAAAALAASDAAAVPSYGDMLAYSLSVGPYNQRTGAFAAGAKIRDRYQLQLDAEGSGGVASTTLKVTVGRATCSAGSLQLTPGSAVTLDARAYRAYRGRVRFRLFDAAGTQVAAATSSFNTSGSSSPGRWDRVCKKIASMISLP